MSRVKPNSLPAGRIEDLTLVIDDIKRNYKSFKNEEQIRFSLVGRILLTCGWNIWNPSEVSTEDHPDSTRKRADITLKEPNQSHDVSHIIIEVKGPNQSLDTAVNQLYEYITQNLAFTIGIVTNGNEWRYYVLTTTNRKITDRLFLTMNLVTDDTSDLCFHFRNLLQPNLFFGTTSKGRKNAEKLLTTREEEARWFRDTEIEDSIRNVIKRYWQDGLDDFALNAIAQGEITKSDLSPDAKKRLLKKPRLASFVKEAKSHHRNASAKTRTVKSKETISSSSIQSPIGERKVNTISRATYRRVAELICEKVGVERFRSIASDRKKPPLSLDSHRSFVVQVLTSGVYLDDNTTPERRIFLTQRMLEWFSCDQSLVEQARNEVHQTNPT